MRRFYVKRQLEELEALDRCENKDTRVYREAAESGNTEIEFWLQLRKRGLLVWMEFLSCQYRPIII